MEHEIIHFLRNLEAWHWGVFGLLLLMAEMFVPAFVLLWFGVSALFVSILLFFDPELSWQIQVTIWSCSAILETVLWRIYRVYAPVAHAKEYQSLNRRGDNYIGREFILDTPIISRRGVLNIGDGSWIIESHEESIEAGKKVVVVEAVGTILHVKSAI